MASGASRTLFWSIVGSVVVTDLVTKIMVVQALPSRVPLIGEWVTFQLVYNPGAAFGIHVGSYSRWVFTTLAIIALFVLGAMVRQTLGVSQPCVPGQLLRQALRGSKLQDSS